LMAPLKDRLTVVTSGYLREMMKDLSLVVKSESSMEPSKEKTMVMTSGYLRETMKDLSLV